MTNQIDTLSKFGTSFQTKCLVALLTDRPFTEQIKDITKSSYFEGDGNQWIVDKIMWYSNEYRALPTLEVFKKEIDKVTNDVTRAASIMQLREVYKQIGQNEDDLKYVKDEFLTFCKNQAIKAAITKSVTLLERGNYDEIKSVIDKAMHAGQEQNVGHLYLDDLQSRVSKQTRNVIATAWPCINQIMDGGLGAGELGCVIAPSGIGKSWFLAAIGAAALYSGKKVVHYTFELSETYLGLRYDTIYTGIESSQIRNNIPKVQAALEEIKGQLVIKYFPTRTITINSITAHIEQLKRRGFHPDLIIIDYADLMKSIEKSNAKHEELGYIYEEIRGMLGLYQLPGWTASQAQRSALQDDIVEADKIAGGYSKVMVCDFIMSIARKMADKMTNVGRVHVPKNRMGPDGMTFPADIDLTTGNICVWDENSPQGILTKRRMQSGDGVVKQLLAKKLIHTATNAQDDI
jgi:replicative DNA helicase